MIRFGVWRTDQFVLMPPDQFDGERIAARCRDQLGTPCGVLTTDHEGTPPAARFTRAPRMSQFRDGGFRQHDHDTLPHVKWRTQFAEIVQ